MRFNGEAMYQLRLRQNMSRADLAIAIRSASRGEIKATERGIRGWEKNEYVPHAESVPAIADALGCEITDLFESNGNGESDEDRLPRQTLSGDLQTLARVQGILERRPDLLEALLAAEAEAL